MDAKGICYFNVNLFGHDFHVKEKKLQFDFVDKSRDRV